MSFVAINPKNTLRYSGVVPGKTIGRRDFNNINKAALRSVGIFWHRELRPKHFTNRATREYGYQARLGEPGRTNSFGFLRSYTGRKLKKFGHTRPLEYTGKSRSLTEIRDVRATNKAVRVVLHAPGYNRRNRHSPIIMRDELVAVSPGDLIRMIRVMQRAVTAGIRAFRKTKTKRF